MGIPSVGRGALLVACLLVGSLSAGAVGSGAPSVASVSYEGDADLGVDREVSYVWQSGQHRVSTSVEGLDDSLSYEVCLRDGEGATGRILSCHAVEAGTSGSTAAFEFSSWPENATGERTLQVVVREANDSTALATGDLRVHVLRRDGDVDGDGLDNDEEIELGTNLTAPDTDDDNLSDGSETEEGTDPLSADTDGDGLDDGSELEAATNPNRADTDDDGLDDHVELTVYDTDPTAADADGDGLDDGSEVHDHQTNPTTVDTDGDGFEDGAEVTVHDTDPNTVDTDADGLSDRAEVSTHQTDPTAADTDGDGLADGVEVNSYDTNPNNADTDGDGLTDDAEIDRGTNPRMVNTEADAQSGVPFVGTLSDGGLAAVLLLGGAALAAATYLGVRSRLGSSRKDSPAPPAGDEGASDSTAAADGTDADPESTGAETGAASRESAATVGPRTAEGSGGAVARTDEERILGLLDREGGRIRQTNIVDETGWSKSKVSKLLARMDDAGLVRKVDTGRENLITRPGDEPDIARSRSEETESRS